MTPPPPTKTTLTAGSTRACGTVQVPSRVSSRSSAPTHTLLHPLPPLAHARSPPRPSVRSHLPRPHALPHHRRWCVARQRCLIAVRVRAAVPVVLHLSRCLRDPRPGQPYRPRRQYAVSQALPPPPLAREHVTASRALQGACSVLRNVDWRARRRRRRMRGRVSGAGEKIELACKGTGRG